MVHAIRLEARARGAHVRKTLSRMSEREVALILPLGEPAALADPDELRALHEYCQAGKILVVIVGGDESLRAHAVAAGFAVATSLQDWESDKHAAARPGRNLLGLRRAKPTKKLAEEQSVRLVHTASAEERNDVYALDGDDPPRYVAELVADDETLTAPQRLTGIPTIPLVPTRRQRRIAEAQRERAEADAIHQALQRYEEQITQTIRSSATDDLGDLGDACAADEPEDATS
jgi:hypothetical protein